jgi:hypothetical protein
MGLRDQLIELASMLPVQLGLRFDASVFCSVAPLTEKIVCTSTKNIRKMKKNYIYFLSSYFLE